MTYGAVSVACACMGVRLGDPGCYCQMKAMGLDVSHYEWPEEERQKPKCSNNTPRTTQGEKRMGAYSQDFIEFWTIYPKKSSKFEAFQVWRKMTALEKHAALKSITAHVQQWQLEDREKRFIRDARRWLLNKNWEDEIDTVTNPQCFWNRSGNRGAGGQCVETSIKQDANGNWYCKAHSFTLGLVVSR